MKLEPPKTAAPDAGLLRSYAPPAGGWDEMLSPSGEVRPAWSELAATLAGMAAVRHELQDLEVVDADTGAFAGATHDPTEPLGGGFGVL